MTDADLAPLPPLTNMDPPVSDPPSPFDPSSTAFQPAVIQKPPHLSPPYPPTSSKRPKPHKPTSIADRLMRKAREAKIRFAARKKEIEAEMLKEMKATPTINPTSREIAEKNFLMRYFPDKMQQVMQQGKPQKLQSEGDYHTPAFPSPKSGTPAFLNGIYRADAQTERQESVEREKRETFVMVPRCHVSLPKNSSTKVYIPIRLGPDDGSKLVTPDYGLSAIALLRKVKAEEEYEERFIDPLDMNAEQRGKYFLEQKERKLKAEMEKKLAEEARLCTFTPSISHSPRLSESQSQISVSGGPSVALTDRSRLSQTSYTDRYQKKQELIRASALGHPKKPAAKPEEPFKAITDVRVPPPNNMFEASLPKAQPGPPREDVVNPFYSQLSPTAQTLCFRAGCDFSALQERVSGKKK